MVFWEGQRIYVSPVRPILHYAYSFLRDFVPQQARFHAIAQDDNDVRSPPRIIKKTSQPADEGHTERNCDIWVHIHFPHYVPTSAYSLHQPPNPRQPWGSCQGQNHVRVGSGQGLPSCSDVGEQLLRLVVRER